MKEKQFYFVPLKGRSTIIREGELFLTITSNGQLNFGKHTLLNLGVNLEKGCFIEMFCDVSRRAIGFKVFKDATVGDRKNNIRQLKPRTIKNKNSNSSHTSAKLSVRTFLSALKDAKLPTGRMYIEEYEDKDEYISTIGKLYYVIVPRKNKQNNEEKQISN